MLVLEIVGALFSISGLCVLLSVPYFARLEFWERKVHELPYGAVEKRSFDELGLWRQHTTILAASLVCVGLAVLLLTGVWERSSTSGQRNPEDKSKYTNVVNPSPTASATTASATPGPVHPPVQPPVARFPWGRVIAWTLLFLFGIGLFVVGFLQEGRKGAALGLGGTLAMTASLLGGSNTLFKIHIEKMGELQFKLDHVFEIKPGESAKFSPEHLVSISNFPSGAVNLDESTAKELLHYCKTNLADKGGLIVIIGATDRVPLHGDLKRRFESNFGLARARAEDVKSVLVKPPPKDKPCLEENRVLALVSGPQHTEEISSKGEKLDLSSDADRIVDIWAFWDNPLQNTHANVERYYINSRPQNSGVSQRHELRAIDF